MAGEVGGGALGLDPIAEANDEQWIEMYETNVLGVMRVTRALMPALERRGNAHLAILDSIAGVEVYPGGGGYTAAKRAVHALAQTLRLELLGKAIRITEIAPGVVETEFSLVRFEGDSERAGNVYERIKPLSAGNVAKLIAFVLTRPPHVNIDYVSANPVAQATATVVHREPKRPR